MSRSTSEYLSHILEETDYLLTNSKNVSKKEFVQNETLKRAYVRSFEIIGEAVKQLPLELRDKYTQVDWRFLAGMRDRLVHNYFGVDYDIAWDAITSKIPDLDTEIKKILSEQLN